MLIEQPSFTLEISDEANTAFAPYLGWFATHQDVYMPITDSDPLLSTPATPIKPVTLALRVDERSGRFRLHWKHSENSLKIEVQCDQLLDSLIRGPMPKKGPLNQALGKKTKIVFDATGGWGNDSMLFACQGMSVLSVERNPIMAMMFHQAMQSIIPYAQRNEIAAEAVPVVHFGSATQLHAKLMAVADIDCIYFDPMFPPKKKKSAKSNKQMQLAQSLLQGDPDASSVAASLLAQGARRLVVKRPHYAASLLPNAEQTFSANLVEYDVYLNY
jgi:16S rRNA (guanine1516-N2)-methyltransferase